MTPKGPKPPPESLTLNGDALAWTGGVEAAPDWLSPAAVAHWDRLRPGIAGNRDLTEVERTRLAMGCEAMAKWQEARAQVEREGLTAVGGTGGPIVNPASKVADAAWSQAMKALSYFKKSGSKAVADSGVPDKSRFFRGPRAATG